VLPMHVAVLHDGGAGGRDNGAAALQWGVTMLQRCCNGVEVGRDSVAVLQGDVCSAARR